MTRQEGTALKVKVLDASALLAYVFGEPGADVVEAQLPAAVIHTVNLAEVLARLTERGLTPEETIRQFEAAGVLPLLRVDMGVLDDALESARLRPLTRRAGLSLGDRYCLALARRLGAAALTADRQWLTLGLDVDVENIRP